MPVDCVVLEIPKEECIRRCEARRHHETIRPGEEREVVERMNRQFEPPHRGECFRNVQRASHVRRVDDLVKEYSNIRRYSTNKLARYQQQARKDTFNHW